MKTIFERMQQYRDEGHFALVVVDGGVAEVVEATPDMTVWVLDKDAEQNGEPVYLYAQIPGSDPRNREVTIDEILAAAEKIFT